MKEVRIPLVVVITGSVALLAGLGAGLIWLGKKLQKKLNAEIEEAVQEINNSQEPIFEDIEE